MDAPSSIHDRRADRLRSAYLLLGRAHPRGFRIGVLRAAADDAAEAVRLASMRRGRGGAWAAGMRSLIDLALRIPAERRREHGSSRRGESMGNAVTRVRRAIRGLARRPGYASVAVLTLGLGIAANVAIFAVVDGVLLKPLEYPDSDRIVEVAHHAPGLDLPALPQSAGTSLMYLREVRAFSAYAALETQGRTLAGDPGTEARRLTVLAASSGFFSVFGVRPALGRAFVPADSEVGAPPVALLGHELWTNSYGSDPEVVGRAIRLDGESVEVVGVLPPGTRLPDRDFDAMIALPLDPEDGFGSFSHEGVARLAPGVDLESARAEVTALQERIPEFFPDVGVELLDAARWRASVTPAKEAVVAHVRPTLWILMGTVAFVLLIAAANVANLVLVRAEARHRETAVRTALGAARGDLFAGFLAESAVLSVAGTGVGLALAAVTLRALMALAPDGLPRREAIGLSPAVFLFAAALAVAAAGVFALLPLMRSRVRDVAGALREGLRGGTSSRATLRARNALVVVQLALALVLVAGSGLMLRSFQALRAVDPGFEPEGVTSVRVSLDQGYVEPGAVTRFYRELQDRVRSLPGVQGVGMASEVPLEGRGRTAGSFEVEGWDRPDDAPPVVAWRQRVTPGYLETLGIALEDGRLPLWADAEDRAEVVWVTRTLADRYIGPDPVGRRIRDSDESPWMVVAGVVGDVAMDDLDDEPAPGVLRLVETADIGQPAMQVAVLVKGPEPAVLVPAMRSILRDLDPGVPLSITESMVEIVARDMADTSFTALMLGIASLLSLTLGAVGIYGVISYVVAQRTRELGVRMALGAAAGDVRAMVVRQGLTVTVVGLGVGLVAAVAITRVLGSLLYEVSTTDPLVLGGTTLLLLLVSLAASFLPARRASRVDPVEALRSE
ncbi:ABC transporter permease [Gaopeijia maritima]|uniref:ABC transporter permease n=1 Tax=Gaopeijia maritima TaxID=3119007 RepID=A0ABU9EB10_9BACT